MSRMYKADNVGKDGTVYPTVGEHIRETSSDITVDDIVSSLSNNTDRAKITDKLETSAEVLKLALVSLLTGKTAHFGGLDVDALTSDELTQIKTYLGIS